MTDPSRPVTEHDLRHPAFTNVTDLGDLEFNAFGQIVSKKRFENAVHKLNMDLYGDSRRVWFVETLTDDIRGILYYLTRYDLTGDELHEALADTDILDDMLPEANPLNNEAGQALVELLLEDGSLLRNVTLTLRTEPSPQKYQVDFTWRDVLITAPIAALRLQKPDSVAILREVGDQRALSEHSTRDKQEYIQSLDGSPIPPPPPISRLR